MRYSLIILIMAIQTLAIEARQAIPDYSAILNGYAAKVSGDDFSYHSSIQFAKECLLARATDGYSSVEWLTDPVPLKNSQPVVTFVWLAGIGSSPGKASFDLSVNGQKKFTFWADGSDEWTLTADDGSSLSFHKDMTDQHGDRFGFMFLNLPASGLKSGEPVRLKVTGGKHSLTSWYMTFKFPLQKRPYL
jgi:alpha-mannosidase